MLFNQYLEVKRVHTFPKGICPKVNVLAQLEVELAVHCFNHYPTKTTPRECKDAYISFGCKAYQIITVYRITKMFRNTQKSRQNIWLLE